MSSLNVAEITQVLRELLPTSLDNGVSTDVPLFAQGERKPELAGLPTVKRLPASGPHGPFGMETLVGNVSGGSYNPSGALNAPGSAHNRQLQSGWGKYQAALQMNLYEMNQIALGQSRIENWMQAQMDEVRNSIVRGIGPDIMTGNAANLIDGLFSRAVLAANIHRGINRAVFPNYGCVVYDSPGIPRNITVPILEAAWNNYTMTAVPDYNRGNWVGITDAVQMTALEGLAAGNIAVWNTNSAVKQLGAQGVSVKGRPVFDLGAPAGSILFINIDQLHWEFLENAPFIVQDVQVVGDRYTWNVYSHCQLVLRNPRKSAFRIDDLI
jgi:hypothetical protein